jgi:cold shock CspA family protein
VNYYDDERGYGFIRTSCGKLLLLHVTCLRASGYQTVPGLEVTCEGARRSKGWLALRLLSLVNRRK